MESYRPVTMDDVLKMHAAAQAKKAKPKQLAPYVFVVRRRTK